MVSKKIANYLNRKSTISKRAEELSTLCDVDVLLILYGFDSPNIPETLWCSQSDPATVIDKYYANKKPAKKMMMSGDDDQFLEKLSLDELKDLNCFLAGKIDYVKQRINGIKEGNKGFSNSYETRDLIDCGKTGYIDYNGGLNVYDLGCEGNDSACSSWRFVDDVDVEFELNNPISADDYCEDTADELMIDISDLNNIKFVGDDDLQLINRLATVQDNAASACH